jgi:predicted RNA binding protein YcfA (HicA-like mRNA interferase family)
MPTLGPIKRSQLIKFLKQLGFDGPYVGGKHQFMLKGTIRLTLPNPHQQDISVGLLARILRQASIERTDWEKL